MLKGALSKVDEAMQKAKAEAAAEISRLQLEVANAQAASQAEIERLEGEITSAQNELEAERAKSANGGKQLAEAHEHIAELGKCVAKLEGEAAAAASQRAALEKALTEARDGNSQLEAERAVAKKVAAAVNRAIKNLNDSAAKTKVQELEAKGLDKDSTPEMRAEAMAAAVVGGMGLLEESVAELASIRKDKKKLEKEHDLATTEAAELKTKCGSLEEEVTDLKGQLQQLSQGAGANAGQAAKMQADIAQCVERITPVLPAKEAKAAEGRVTRLVDALVERAKSVEAQLVKMSDELARAAEALSTLKVALSEAEKGNGGEMAAVEQRAKQARAKLVASALESMNHLRSHLISTLTGLRECSPPMMRPPMIQSQPSPQMGRPPSNWHEKPPMQFMMLEATSPLGIKSARVYASPLGARSGHEPPCSARPASRPRPTRPTQPPTNHTPQVLTLAVPSTHLDPEQGEIKARRLHPEHSVSAHSVSAPLVRRNVRGHDYQMPANEAPPRLITSSKAMLDRWLGDAQPSPALVSNYLQASSVGLSRRDATSDANTPHKVRRQGIRAERGVELPDVTSPTLARRSRTPAAASHNDLTAPPAISSHFACTE